LEFKRKNRTEQNVYSTNNACIHIRLMTHTANTDARLYTTMNLSTLSLKHTC